MAAIKDVAALAGYSPAAVSKYLKNPDSVRQETREKIEAAIKELNYVPSAAARSLRTGRTNEYLLIVSQLNNPYFVETFLQLNEEANRRGVKLLLQTAQSEETDYREKPDFYVPAVHQVDGIIVMIAKSEEIIPQIQNMAETLPVVAYGWPYPVPQVDTVIIDMEEAIYEAAHSLVEKGHKKIAYIADHTENYADIEKSYGYRKALQEAGIRVPEAYFCVTPSDVNGGYRAAEKLLSLPEPPTAVVCENDVMAIGVLRCARDRGIRVPEDLAVTGQDDCYLAAMSTPQLTTTKAPGNMMARAAFDMLTARRGKLDSPNHCVVYHAELIERASSEKK